MNAPDGTGPEIHVVAVVPPPVNGMTLVSRQMAEVFGARLRLRDRTVCARRGQTGLAWTLTRHGGFLGGLMAAAAVGLLRRRAEKPVCYFVPDAGAGLWLNLCEVPLLRLGYRRVWLHHHVFSYVARRDRRMALFLALLGDSARHITLGPAMSAGLARHYGLPAAQLRVLGNAGFVTDPPGPAPARPALRQVGFLGNITREKGIGFFMQTVAAAQERSPTLAAVIAGPIADEGLRAEIETFCAEAPETRRWIGPVRGEKKALFLRETDLLLFPSRYANEAQPMTIYEALAAGIPVLATARGCIPDQLAGTGWVVPDARFVQEATAQITTWTTNPAAFAEASRQATACFAAQHSQASQALEALVGEIGQGA